MAKLSKALLRVFEQWPAERRAELRKLLDSGRRGRQGGALTALPPLTPSEGRAVVALLEAALELTGDASAAWGLADGLGDGCEAS